MSLPVEKTEIETFFGRCRCCLTYGYLKNMWIEHQFDGETEIYGEMLVQCFALSWNHTSESLEQDQICEPCIIRLRDACDFKKVVLESQDELMQQIDAENSVTIKEETLEEEYIIEDYQGPESEPDTAENTYADTEYNVDTADTENTADMDSVKDEMEYEEIEYLEEDDNGEQKKNVDTDSSHPTDALKPVKRRKQLIKQGPEDDAPKRKWPKRLPKAERLKTYKQYTEENLRQCMEAVRNNKMTPNEASSKFNIPKKTICAKIKLDPKDVQTDIQESTNNATTQSETRSQSKQPAGSAKNTKQTKSDKTAEEALDKKTEEQNKFLMMKHKNNLKMILKYSNATMIKAHSGAGYSCCFCDQHFTPENLKKHNLEHGDVYDDAIKVKYVSDLIVKIDITGLQCNICFENINSLEDFMKHLQEIHDKKIHTEIENYIIPFKFDTENLQCVICSKVFRYFKMLSEHMCEHYRNFECNICHRPFINKQSMQTHIYRHNKGSFKCPHCPKVFDNRYKVNEHKRVVHILFHKKRKCGYCTEKFSSADMVRSHERKVHGVALPKFHCEACDKPFFSQKTLTIHTKRHHLMMRPFECEECGAGFFTRQELVWHSVTHTKTRDYQCDWCDNAFGTKPALNQHMRAHLGDRKYECKHCDIKYVHLSTWKTHMMTQHGEKVENVRK